MKIILSLLVVNFLLASYFIIMGKSSAATPQTSAPSEPLVAQSVETSGPAAAKALPVCYQFTTNELNRDTASIANATQNKIKEEKKYNIYWGLSANKEEALNKYKELQTNIFEGQSMELVYISQQYSLLLGKTSSEPDALSQVRRMTEKTASMGGRWFYGTYMVPTYQIKFNAVEGDEQLQKLQKIYNISRCK